MTAARARARTELAARWRLDAGDYVVAADVSRDGRRCALGTGGGEVVVADVLTGAVAWRARVHPAGVLRGRGRERGVLEYKVSVPARASTRRR